MTPESQRIAIAEACGWSIHQITVTGLKDVAILPPNVSIKDEGAVWKYAGLDLPDYLNDLNAMHEAEKVLTPSQKNDYMRILFYKFGDTFTAIHTTAAQRAEAFLRTLGPWKD